MSLFGFDPNADSYQPVRDPLDYSGKKSATKACPIGRVFADRSATVVFFYENELETLKVFGFTIEEATKIGNAFIAAVRAAKAQRDKLTGRAGWTRLEESGERRLMTHMGMKVWVRPSVIRKGATCRACGKEIASGATAYVEAERVAWETNWRDLRLCVECVDAPKLPEGVTSILAAKRRAS